MPMVKMVDVDLVLALTVFFGSLFKSKYPLEVWFKCRTPCALDSECVYRSHRENNLSLEEDRS